MIQRNKIKMSGNCRVAAMQLLAMTVIIIFPLYGYCKDVWQLLYQPRQRVVKTIGIYKDQIFIGTGSGVLVSKDEGKIWQDFGTNQLLKGSNGLSSINWIYIDEKNNKIYILGSSYALDWDLNLDILVGIRIYSRL